MALIWYFSKEVLELKRKNTEDNKNIKKYKVQRINSLEDELSTTPSLFERLQSNIKSSKLPVSKVSAGPVVTNVEVIGNSMILDESQSLRNTQSKVSSSSNNREFQLIDYSKVNYDVSTIEPLDFSKANETVFSTTTADNNSTIEKSGTPATPEKITDEQSLLEETTGLQSTQEDITGAASTFSGETIMNDGIEVKRIEDIEAHDISIGALHTFMPNDFTEDDVRSFLKVYAGLEDAHKYQSKNNAKLCVTTQVEILTGSGVFLFQDRITYIINNFVDKVGNPSWKKFVALVIQEVYGDTIGHYSANGKRSCDYPGIDSNFYVTLLKWVQSRFATEKITRQNYTTVINNIAWKKRTKETAVAPDEISEGNLKFFKKIVIALKKNITWQGDSESQDKSVHHLLEPGPSKTKIWESYIYFPKNVISYIERKSSISPDISDWKALVKEALLEIYQSEITNFSAKGTRLNKNVGIDPQVFRAILGE
ncbi:hypothetical protein KQX54_013378 [Cotesia glomerata]|uniref:Uncharacterized protein n=1 Tax=Cotesia glomerata TaxID=32391 RepID=A0AAV7J7H6_COTGL|nr:hypothetical protein KQX54_013378 [Cotesia glomerata]